MGATVAREVGHAGAHGAPLCRFRPLGGAPIVADAVARRDRRTVDGRGRNRTELPSDGGGHALVDQRHALGHLTLADEDRALEAEPVRLEIEVCEAATDLKGAAGGRQRAVEIPARDEDVGLPQGQLAVLWSFGLVREQSLRLGEPASPYREASLPEVVARQRQRHAGRAATIPGLCVCRRAALAEANAVASTADPEGGVPQAFEILGRQAPGCVGRREQIERVLPRVPRDRVPPRFQRIVGHALDDRSEPRVASIVTSPGVLERIDPFSVALLRCAKILSNQAASA